MDTKNHWRAYSGTYVNKQAPRTRPTIPSPHESKLGGLFVQLQFHAFTRNSCFDERRPICHSISIICHYYYYHIRQHLTLPYLIIPYHTLPLLTTPLCRRRWVFNSPSPPPPPLPSFIPSCSAFVWAGHHTRPSNCFSGYAVESTSDQVLSPVEREKKISSGQMSSVDQGSFAF